jgi:hypothetical protein
MNQRKSRGNPIRKLPSGRYQVMYRDANGIRHRESFDREKEARATLDERRAEGERVKQPELGNLLVRFN